MDRITFPLKPRQTGAAVAILQDGLRQLLASKAFLTTEATYLRKLTSALAIERVTSVYGPTTVTLVTTWQGEHDLKISGEVDEVTAASLNKALGIKTPAPPPPAPAPPAPPPPGQPPPAPPPPAPPPPGPPPPAPPPPSPQPVFSVRGVVRFADGTPAAGLQVRAVDRDLRSEEPLGSVAADAAGAYRIAYSADQLRRSERGSADLQLRAVNPINGQFLASSAILFNAPADAVVDLVVPAEAMAAPSLFERIAQALPPLLGEVEIASIEEDEKHQDLTFLAGESGFARADLARFVQAQVLARQAVAAEFWFALLGGPPYAHDESRSLAAQRAALPEALPGIDEAAAGKALAAGFARNDIAASLRPKGPEWIAAFRAFAMRKLLAGAGFIAPALDSAGIADPGKRATFATLYAEHGAMTTTMVEALAATRQFKPAEIADLRASEKIASVAGVEFPAVRAIKTMFDVADIEGVRSLARKSAADWTKALKGLKAADRIVMLPLTLADGSPLPPDPARDGAMLADKFRAAFPSAAFAGGLERAVAGKQGSKGFGQGERLLAFLDAHPGFDLLNTPLDSFLAASTTSKFRSTAREEPFVTELRAAQRLVRLAPSFEAADAMLADGVHSARQVYAMGETAFVDRYGGRAGLSADEAKIAWNRAADTQAAVLTLVGDLYSLNGEAVPAALANNNAALARFPNWENLFKAGDLCACEHCRSVLSPAAYFADLLNFLKDRAAKPGAGGGSVRDLLFSRRPDNLGYLELSCENALTPLPYVDIACEVLEAAIAQGASDVGTGLSAMRVTEAMLLTALKSQGLRPGTHCSFRQVKPGDSDRWVVHGDETTYLLHRSGAGQFFARILPNTKASADELRACPAYVDAKAYEMLRQAAFPHSLPFDLFGEEVRAGLAKTGLRRWELMEVFRGPAPPPSPYPPAAFVAAEYFAIGADPAAPFDEMRLIFNADPGGQQALWGETGNAPWLDYAFFPATLPPPGPRIALVKTFLLKTGLDYDELLTLLDLPFINGSVPGTVHIEHQDAGCDTDKKVIRGLDVDVLDRVHRFLRLWRKLGWKMWEVDLAIRGPGVGGGTLDADCLVNLFHLARLRERLGSAAGVEQLCALCDDLNHEAWFTRPYKPRGDALYQRLFLNPKLVRPLDPAFEVDQVTASTGETLTGHSATLLAGLGLSAADLALLKALKRADTGAPYLADDKLTLANLSFLWRHAWLAKRLKLTPGEWATALKLLHADISDPVTPTTALPDMAAASAFVERLDQLRASGFSIDQLDWLIAANREAKAGAKAADAIRFLTGLRKDLQAVAAEFDPARYPFLAPPSGPTDEVSLRALLTTLLVRLGRDEAGVAEFLATLATGVVAEAKVTGMPSGFTIPAAIDDQPNYLPISYDASTGVLRYTRDMSQAEKAILLGSSMPAAVTGNPSYIAAIDDLYELSRVARHKVKFFDPTFTSPLAKLPGGIDFAAALPADLAARIRYDSEQRRLVFAGLMTRLEKAALDALAPAGPAGADYRAAVAGLADEPGTVPPWETRVWLKDTDLTMIGMANRLATAIAKALAHLKVTASLAAAREKAGAQLGLSEALTLDLLSEHPVVAGASLFGDWYWNFTLTSGPVDEAIPAMAKRINGWTWATRVAGLWKGWKISDAEHQSLRALETTAGLLLPVLVPRDAADFAAMTRAYAIMKVVDPLLRTAGLIRFRDDVAEAGIGFLDLLVKLPTYPSKAAFAADVTLLAGWEAADAEALVNALDPAYPAAYRQADCWQRLARAFAFIDGLDADAMTLVTFAQPAMQATHAARLRALLRGKFGNESWLGIGGEIQDVLRERKRASLTAYMLVHPELAPGLIPGTKWENENDLYAHFLIDVEMCACQLTSRLVQASGSVQLFVQRCLMGLERQVEVDEEKDSAWRWWAWMRKATIWRANREVYLWPQNWIRPELKPDRSQFFKELETELQQNELNRDSVEAAFASYLEKLDGVAQLEIAGYYQEDDGGEQILHVFGRTKDAEPHIYYYRRYDYRAWTPWERVELDIQGDYLLPAVIGKRLFLFWPAFTEIPDETANQSIKTPSANSTMPLERVKKRLRMQLATSSFRQGKWTPKQLSTDFAETAQTYQQDIDKRGYYFIAADTSAIDNRFGIYYGGYSWYGEYNGTGSLNVVARLFGGFEIGGCTGAPVAAGLPYRLSTTRVPSWDSIDWRGDHMHLTETPNRLDAPDDDLTFQMVNPVFQTSSTTILGRTPGLFQVTLPRQTGYLDPLAWSDAKDFSVPQSYANLLPFFYNDQQRTFFVTPMLPRIYANGATSEVESTDRYYPDLVREIRANERIGVPWIGSHVEIHHAHLPKAEREHIKRRSLASYRHALRTELLLNAKGQRCRFQTFYHPFVCDFARLVNNPLEGIPGLMRRQTQLKDSGFGFGETYRPTQWVQAPGNQGLYPKEDVDFTPGGAYSSYNWELFFQAPLLIANALSRDQRFAEAREWYHFIFNPLGVDSPVAGGSPMSRYWITRPFFETSDPDYIKQRIDNILLMLADPAASATRQELENQVRDSRIHPFDPHRIAAYRTSAYQMTVVMNYLDNLIAWGDNLFAQDSMESINEATQLYLLADEILGPRPIEVAPPARPPVETYNELEHSFDDFSNALIQVENLIPPQSGGTGAGNAAPLPMLYFCIPHNSKLLGYWDTVADRLFKIRHCMNIEGVVRQLALFEPRLDPGAMVKAVAGGAGIGGAFADLAAPLPHYRFNTLLLKANEICNDVKALGGSLLAALEKQDAEALGLLRQSHEMRMLQAAVAVRELQIEEAKENLEGAHQSRLSAETRRDYYRDIERLSDQERLHLDKMMESHKKAEIAQGIKVGASIISYLPDIDLGASGFGGTPLIKFKIGGINLGQAASLASDVLSFLSQIAANDAAAASSQATFKRRGEEWDHQLRLAERELEQIDRQIAAAELRVKVAEAEFANQLSQIENAKAVDEFMHSKFTSLELYQWQVGQISDVYFRSYKLAFDIAKRAERCLRFELGLEDSSYVSFGYWDSLKKGLLAGERLQYDLRRMETGYLERNARRLELTKHVSLALNDPLALVRLRETGRCVVTLPEELFDLDYPGHYDRRIQSVSLTVPCVTGPYTTIACTLRLARSSVRTSTALAGGYAREQEDDRFVERKAPVRAIAASSGQNDSGLFELNFRDERFLPFEGAGAISEWILELFNDGASGTTDFGKPLRQFDYDTVSDVVLHVKYSAREDAGKFKDAAVANLRTYFSADDPSRSLRVLNLKQEFPSEWARFVDPATTAPALSIKLVPELFRVMDKGKTLQITDLWLIARSDQAVSLGVTPPAGTTSAAMPLNETEFGKLRSKHILFPSAVAVDTAAVPGTLTIHGAAGIPGKIDELHLVFRYHV